MAGESDINDAVSGPDTSSPGSARLLDDCLDSTEMIVGAKPKGARRLFDIDGFLKSQTYEESFKAWAGDRFEKRRSPSKNELICQIAADIAAIDDLLNAQVNAIIHHHDFQKLEGSWRGLHYLVHQNEDPDAIKIRVLNVTWVELGRDLERAIEFDQSQLFRKVYSNEFGMPGGKPFGVLLGDYEIRHRPTRNYPIDDLSTVAGIAQVSAAAFAPFIVGAHPHFFGIDNFREFERPLSLTETFQQAEYLKWRRFREHEDSRFVGIVMPRVLMREPYSTDKTQACGFPFREEISTGGESKHLWGSAVYAFGSVLIRAFQQTRWLAQVRGVIPWREERGLVTNLVCPSFETDADGIAIKCPTDVVISDKREIELAELGMIPLCACRGSEYAAFYSMQSVQKPKVYDREIATKNGKIATMLQHTFCVSRFAHHLKVLGRENIGRFRDPSECEDMLYRWLQKYVTSDEDASEEVKARYPLQEATVQVRERPDKPGSYACIIRLKPHFQLEQLVGSIKLVTDIDMPAAV